MGQGDLNDGTRALTAAHSCARPAQRLRRTSGGGLLVYGRRIPKAELFARIDAVDASTIRAVCQKFLMDQDIAVAAMGDLQDFPDYNWLRRRTYWLRY